jgi:hypothetical protein
MIDGGGIPASAGLGAHTWLSELAARNGVVRLNAYKLQAIELLGQNSNRQQTITCH